MEWAKIETEDSIFQIILIEDDVLLGDITRKMVELLGFECIVYTNRDEALDQISQEFSKMTNDFRFPIIIMDVFMPGMGPDTFIHKIDQIDFEIPIIITSGASKEEILMKNFYRYAENFIQKPYTPADIERCIEHLITEHEMRINRSIQTNFKHMQI